MGVEKLRERKKEREKVGVQEERVRKGREKVRQGLISGMKPDKLLRRTWLARDVWLRPPQHLFLETRCFAVPYVCEQDKLDRHSLPEEEKAVRR